MPARDILTTWIEAWAGATAGGGGRASSSRRPSLKDPGASKSFPAIAGVVRRHRLSAPRAVLLALPQLDRRGGAVAVLRVRRRRRGLRRRRRRRSNLDQPAMSRLVVRLRTEFHNCWSDCAANANAMEAAIQAFADQVPLTQVDASLVYSKALRLPDGIVASGGNRYTANMIALWEFKTGRGIGRVRHQRRGTGAEPQPVRRRQLGRRLGHQRARRQGAGLDHRQPEAARPDQGHGRVHDRSLGGARQRGAGGCPHRVVLGRHHDAQLHARPDALQLRLLQPRDRHQHGTAIRS